MRATRHLSEERSQGHPVKYSVLAKVVPATAWNQAAKHRPRGAVDSQKAPPVLAVGKHEVVRLHDAAANNVHEVPAEDVRSEEHLARPPLEGAGVESLPIEPNLARRELLDVRAAHEHVAPAHADLDPGHGRIAAAVELHDQVLEPPQLLAGRAEDGAPQDLRDHEPALLPAARRLGGRAVRRRAAVQVLVLVVHRSHYPADFRATPSGAGGCPGSSPAAPAIAAGARSWCAER